MKNINLIVKQLIYQNIYCKDCPSFIEENGSEVNFSERTLSQFFVCGRLKLLNQCNFNYFSTRN